MRIGIDLGGTKIEGIAVAENGEETARYRLATPGGDYRATLAAIKAVVERLDPDPATPVGVGVPGAISPATGTIKNANSTCLIGEKLDVDLQNLLKRPVRIANDANCFTVSEAIDGAAAGRRVVFGIILGTGVGAGLVIDGQIVVGPHAIAGEWGHNPLPWPGDSERPGRQCYCGKFGCLETWLSGPGVSAQFALETGQNADAREIVERAQQNESAAAANLDRFLDRLARGLATVINILDPDAIVVGGGLSNIEDIYRQVPDRLADYVFSDVVRTPVLRNRHGDSGGVRGAAWLWPARL